MIPLKGFECSSEQARQVWLVKAWLYSLRLFLKGWIDTFRVYLLEIGFVRSTADLCLYILNAGDVIIMFCVNDMLLTGNDEGHEPKTIEELEGQFDTVDVADTGFLLGMAIQRNVGAGTIFLTREAYAKAVLDKFGMADGRPAKTAEPGSIFIEGEDILSPEDTKFLRSAINFGRA